MKRQSAFGGNRKMLKGGLHCHTTRSDGKGSPEEVMRLHAENGYDFLALTDHKQYNRTNYAPETGLTLICGMEINSVLERGESGAGRRHFHTVCIGPNDETNGFEQDERFVCADSANQYEFQPYLDKVHAKGNLTFYCHPEWSATSARHFEDMVGQFAMEIWNSGCAIENDMDTNAAYWDELLGQGKRIWGVAVDDGHRMYQHCNGWVMVNAENNDRAILAALAEGNFYSSCGPVIRDFYANDEGFAVIDTDDCEKIWFCSDRHPSRMCKGEDGAPINHAELDMNGKDYTYIRAVVMDKEGRRAWTNPIFLD